MKQLLITTTLSATLVGALFCASGCHERDTTKAASLQPDSSEYVLLVAIDMSGSFREFMAEGGRAYTFLLTALDEYHQQGLGSDFQVIVTQLSGNDEPLLWQGTPRQLRRDFPDPESFRDFLIAHADSGSSRINDGIAESIDYVLHTHSVARGNAKTVALILSDMEDNHSDDEASERRLMDALTTYAGRGGIGFYFCSQKRMAGIRRKMEQAGYDMYILESDIYGRPPIPNFE